MRATPGVVAEPNADVLDLGGSPVTNLQGQREIPNNTLAASEADKCKVDCIYLHVHTLYMVAGDLRKPY